MPPRFLVQIPLQLKGAGLVASVRGASGGYKLVKPPREITLGQVMELIEGSAESSGQTGGLSSDSPVVRVLSQTWKEVADVQRKMLHRVTLADLVERLKAEQEQMYHIRCPRRAPHRVAGIPAVQSPGLAHAIFPRLPCRAARHTMQMYRWQTGCPSVALV